MSDVVLDAAVFVAAISPSEIHHAAARELYDTAPEDRPFLVPSVFRTEVLAALEATAVFLMTLRREGLDD